MKTELKDTTKQLNDHIKCTIAPSKIHGVGVFAIRDIKKGENLWLHGSPVKILHRIKDMSKLKPEIRALIQQRWLLAHRGSPFLSPHDDVWLSSFINHSDKANCNKYTDEARENIKKGEEITHDYSPQVKIPCKDK